MSAPGSTLFSSNTKVATMSAFILIAGTLFRNPERRTSKAGKPYVKATLRAKDGEGTSSPLRKAHRCV
jgi:hypothetical protein